MDSTVHKTEYQSKRNPTGGTNKNLIKARRIRYFFVFSEPTCPDGNTNCPYWASIGECEANPGYMLINCQFSCDVCPEGNDDLKGVLMFH